MIDYNSDKQFIVITFLKMKDLLSLKKVITTFPRGIEIISYIDIYNKLVKKENGSNEPSDALISTCIIKKLNELLSDGNISHLCYILDITDNDISYRLNNIIEFITEKSKKPVKFEFMSDDNNIISAVENLNITTKYIQ